MPFSSWSFALTLALSTTLVLCPAGSRGEDSGPLPDDGQAVVAVVNGQPIRENRVTPVIGKERGVKAAGEGARVVSPRRDAVWEKALGQVIDTELLFQAGRQLGIPDLDRKVTAEIATLKTAHAAALEGKSDAEIAELALRQVTIREYLTKNDLLDPQVPEAEVRAFYEKNQHSYATSEELAHVRHILVQIPEEATEEQKGAARKKIEAAAGELAEGKAFEVVAREYSEDAVAATGGDLGEVKRGYMPPEFDAVAFAIDPGQPSDIVETQFGYHIVDVVRRYPKGYIAPFEDVKDFFGKFLKNELTRKKMADHLAMLRMNAKIEIPEAEATPKGAN